MINKNSTPHILLPPNCSTTKLLKNVATTSLPAMLNCEFTSLIKIKYSTNESQRGTAIPAGRYVCTLANHRPYVLLVSSTHNGVHASYSRSDFSNRLPMSPPAGRPGQTSTKPRQTKRGERPPCEETTGRPARRETSSPAHVVLVQADVA